MCPDRPIRARRDRRPTGTLMASIAAPTRGALMRPSLTILDDELIGRIVDEAKRVLAEVGMEIRGAEMRRRLLDHGLPLDASGDRVLFPRDVVEAAIASAPSLVPPVRPRRRAARRPRWRPRPLRARARRGSRCSTIGPARRASRTRPTSSSTSGWPTAWPTSRIWRRPSRPTTTSRPACRTPGGCT